MPSAVTFPPVVRPTIYDAPANQARLAVAAERIGAHAEVFADLERRALELHAAGDEAAAVQACAIAARFAHGSHTGRFASPALEALLRDVGRRRVRAAPRPARRGGDVRRVLHVLTETYHIGGHTRLARRWIDLDAGREHSIFVTGLMQGVTSWLVEASHRTGGGTSMCGGREGAVERAQLLRDAAADADLVVVHAHPFDPVPALAFAEPEDRAPVVFMNHADHAFWLGAGVADGVADFRPSGMRLTRSGRGIAAERCHFLPLPLPRELPVVDRAAARQRLSIRFDGPLLATVGAAYKYGAVLDPAFTDLVPGALNATPGAVLVAVGPEMDARWTAANAATGGRTFAVGFNPDAHTLLEAADLYLDAWPCSSGTAMLEAGLNGVPIVTLWPDPAQPGHLASDIPSLDEHAVVCATPEEHAAAVTALLADPAERARRGAALRETIHDQHAGAGWTEALERLIAGVAAAEPAELPREVPPGPPATWEATIEALHAAAGMGMSADQARHEETAIRRFPPGSLPVSRAVASPAVDAAEIHAVIDAFRDLTAAGRAGNCVVVLPPDRIGPAIPLLEAALAAGADVDVELTQADVPGGLVTPDDVCVAPLNTPLADACAAVGALLRPVLA